MDHITACKAKEGANDDDISRHLSYEEATTMRGKCFLLCLQESFGLVSTECSFQTPCFTICSTKLLV